MNFRNAQKVKKLTVLVALLMKLNVNLKYRQNSAYVNRDFLR